MADPAKPGESQAPNIFGWVSSIAEKGAAFTLMVAGLLMTVVPTLGIFTDLWSNSISLGIYIAALVAGVGAMAIGGLIALITEQSVRRETLAAYQTAVERTNRSADLYERLLTQIVKAEDNTVQTVLLTQLTQVQETLKQSYVLPAPPPKK